MQFGIILSLLTLAFFSSHAVFLYSMLVGLIKQLMHRLLARTMLLYLFGHAFLSGLGSAMV